LSQNNNKCNVLFLSHVSSKEYGGAELVLDNIVSGLDSKKFKSVLLLQKTSEKVEKLGWNCSSKAIIETFDFGSLSHKNKVIGLLNMFFKMFKSFFFIIYLIRKHNINVVCANSLVAAAFSVVPTRFLNIRFCYYEHNIVEQRKGHLIGLALHPVTKLATDIICISKAVKDGLLNDGVSADKLRLVYNGYDFSCLDVPTLIERNLPERHQENVLRIGMVANFMPWKRHKLFIEIMSDLSDELSGIKIEATLVGGCLPGNERYYEEITDWMDGYNGKVDFLLTGFQDGVADYFRSFDILINPAKAEPFGLIFIEAMYLKCVVVGAIEGAAPEIIEDDLTGCVVDYDDKKSTLNRLVELARDKSKRVSLGEKASEVVKNEFSIKKQIQQLEIIFNQK